jgi:rRNA maturation endonuclease Nob1
MKKKKKAPKTKTIQSIRCLNCAQVVPYYNRNGPCSNCGGNDAVYVEESWK